MHDAGNVRRLRESVPLYWDARETIPTLEKDISRDSAEQLRLDREIKAATDRLLNKLTALNVPSAATPSNEELTRIFEDRPEEPELQRLARLRRDIIATRDQWRSIQSPVDAADRDSAERASTEANAALEAWRSSTGSALEGLFARLSEFLSDLALPQAVGPERARAAALQTLNAELNRCVTVLARDADATERIATLDQNMERARSRAAVLDNQIVGHAAAAGTLAQALAAILPHIHSDDCPVCGRGQLWRDVRGVAAGSRLEPYCSADGKRGQAPRPLTRERANAAKTLQADAELRTGCNGGRPTRRDGA